MFKCTNLCTSYVHIRSTQVCAFDKEREKEKRIYVHMYLQEDKLKNINILTERDLLAVLLYFQILFPHYCHNIKFFSF